MQNVARIALINKGSGPKKRKTKKRKTAKRKAKRRSAPKRRTARRNAPKRTTKRKTTQKRRTYKVARKKRTYRKKRYSKPRKTYRRRRAAVVVVNPVEKDVIETLKTGALMTLGGLASYVIADYLKKSVDFIADNEWAGPAVQIASGMGIGMVLTGKNRPLATKLGLGMVMSGILELVTPFLADKLPGLPGTAGEATGTTLPITGYYSPAEMGAYQRIGGYYGDEIPTPMGQFVDPMEEDLNVYGGGLGKGYYQ